MTTLLERLEAEFPDVFVEFVELTALCDQKKSVVPHLVSDKESPGAVRYVPAERRAVERDDWIVEIVELLGVLMALAETSETRERARRAIARAAMMMGYVG